VRGGNGPGAARKGGKRGEGGAGGLMAPAPGYPATLLLPSFHHAPPPPPPPPPPARHACRPAGITEKIDIYSLAMVLYECATGHRPWEGLSNYAVIYKASCPPARPPALLPP
jgi:serine/threonine protein kinase